MLSECRKLLNLARRRPARKLCALLVLALLGLAAYRTEVYVQARYLEPRRQYGAALAALDRREFGEARKHLAACLQAWPDDSTTYFLAARAARRAGDLDEAQEQLFHCQHLQEATGDTSTGDTRLEWALLEAQRGNLLEVEGSLRAGLRDGHPDSLLILEVLSWELMWSGRLQEAGRCLDLWLERQPEEYEALVRRGWVAEHLFDLPAALRDYSKALAIDPEQDQIRLRVAEIHIQKHRAKEALEQLDLLRRLKPDNPDVTTIRARCQRLSGRPQEAQKLLDELLVSHPRDTQALTERGVLALEMGQPAEAEHFLRLAVERDPSNRQVHYNLYLCLQRQGKKGEAEQIATKLAEADAELQRMGRLIRDVMKRPRDPALRYEAGTIFLRNGFTEDGLRWLGTALKADPLHRPTHEALAEYYERIGNQPEAARHRQFVKATPATP